MPIRLYSLDKLRFIAASMVVIFHLQMMSIAEVEFGFLKMLIDHFGSGVTLFFVLSSYSLAYTNSSTSYFEFLKKRLFRIAPLFYLLIIFMTLAKLIFNKYIDPFELFVNSTFVFNLFSQYQESIVFAGWTIGVEMLFYLLFPFLIKLSTRKLIIIVLFLWALNTKLYLVDFSSSYLNTSIFQGKGIIYHLPSFIFGIITYRFSAYLEINFKNRILILVLLSVLIYPAFSKTFGYLGYLFEGLFFSLLTILFLTFKNKETQISIWGLRSYSIYLWHPIVIYTLAFLKIPTSQQILFSFLTFSAVLFISKFSEIYFESIPYRFLKNKYL